MGRGRGRWAAILIAILCGCTFAPQGPSQPDRGRRVGDLASAAVERPVPATFERSPGTTLVPPAATLRRLFGPMLAAPLAPELQQRCSKQRIKQLKRQIAALQKKLRHVKTKGERKRLAGK